MNKDILLLAESAKYQNLCVAGVDIKTGEWIRLISEDNEIHCAVNPKDMEYEDGTLPKVLDIVRIKFKGKQPNFFQPENYVFDDSYYWQKLRQVNVNELLEIHPPENKEYIFFDSQKKVHQDVLRKIPESEKYSLILISPRTVRVHVNDWPERKDVTMSFDYNSERYRFMSITDIHFKNSFMERPQGDYMVGNVLLVLSLGEVYNKDNHHYKLVTTVIR